MPGILFRKAASVDQPRASYNGFAPSRTILPAGYTRKPGLRSFSVDTVWDRDIPIPMRDGIILRADAYWPHIKDGEQVQQEVPALVAYSPYGKSGTGMQILDNAPFRQGVPQSRLSGFQDFEGPDPAEWIPRGYAIVNVDARGIFDSQGDIHCWGPSEGQDGYDAIEHIAQLKWCNGKVALIGNSWLAMNQWYIAAEKPPHLVCIAPLEGATDVYRETQARGGVPDFGFPGMILNGLFGRNHVEDFLSILQTEPYYNDYWKSKRIEFSQIKLPSYILASYSTGLHLPGSIRAFRESSHDKTWLRVHPTQEWYDLYHPSTIEDLQKFFDFYTKGKNNNWESTPRVRLSLLRMNKLPIYNISSTSYPLPNTTYTTLYLSNSSGLSPRCPSSMGVDKFDASAPCQQAGADSGELSYTYTFSRRTILAGYPTAILHVSFEDPQAKDIDVFVQLRKADSSGKLLSQLNIPASALPDGVSEEDAKAKYATNTLVYLGPTGQLRASHRAVDDTLSTDFWPIQSHAKETMQPAQRGQVVELKIGVWPIGMVFEAGEKLVLKISGHPMQLAEFEGLRGAYQNANVGDCKVTWGEGKESRIIIPVVDLDI